MKTRSLGLLLAVLAPLGLAHGGSSAGAAPAAERAQAPAEGLLSSYRFVSSPDFLNTDVGDVTGSRFYRPGKPNSTNASYEAALDKILDTWVAEDPEDVLVAGDLVQGHWGMDSRRTGTFGPVDTEAHKTAALRRAGNTYFSQWVQRFSDRGLPVRVAVGDHDIGDDPWKESRGGKIAFKYRHFRDFKDVFARHAVTPFGYDKRPPKGSNAARTAYATWLHPEVLLVSVDVFRKVDGDVVPELDRAQLNWLDRTLERGRKNGADWIIVQGHTPVLAPVRVTASSGLIYRKQERSAFWRTMRRHHVDLYLAGEVHAISAKYRDGVAQIAHGGRFPGFTSYLVGEVVGDRMYLTVNEMPIVERSRETTLWQTDIRMERVGHVVVGDPRPVGTAVLHEDNRVIETTGMLKHYRR